MSGARLVSLKAATFPVDPSLQKGYKNGGKKIKRLNKPDNPGEFWSAFGKHHKPGGGPADPAAIKVLYSEHQELEVVDPDDSAKSIYVQAIRVTAKPYIKVKDENGNMQDAPETSYWVAHETDMAGKPGTLKVTATKTDYDGFWQITLTNKDGMTETVPVILHDPSDMAVVSAPACEAAPSCCVPVPSHGYPSRRGLRPRLRSRCW
jgi:hypothetical protein